MQVLARFEKIQAMCEKSEKGSKMEPIWKSVFGGELGESTFWGRLFEMVAPWDDLWRFSKGALSKSEQPT